MTDPIVRKLRKRLVSQAQRQEQLEAKIEDAVQRSQETARRADELVGVIDRLADERDEMRIWIVTLLASNPGMSKAPLEEVILDALIIADALNWPDIKAKLRQRVMRP